MVKELRELIKKFIGKKKSFYILHSQCNLECDLCPEFGVYDCWISNCERLIIEFPKEGGKLIPLLSPYTSSKILSKTDNPPKKLAEYLGRSIELNRAEVADKLKPPETGPVAPVAEVVTGSLTIPRKFWYSTFFDNFTQLQKLVLLELIAMANGTRERIAISPTVLTERLHSDLVKITTALERLEHFELITKQEDFYKVNYSKIEEVI
jgi:hypothetical protein